MLQKWMLIQFFVSMAVLIALVYLIARRGRRRFAKRVKACGQRASATIVSYKVMRRHTNSEAGNAARVEESRVKLSFFDNRLNKMVEGYAPCNKDARMVISEGTVVDIYYVERKRPNKWFDKYDIVIDSDDKIWDQASPRYALLLFLVYAILAFVAFLYIFVISGGDICIMNSSFGCVAQSQIVLYQ